MMPTAFGTRSHLQHLCKRTDLDAFLREGLADLCDEGEGLRTVTVYTDRVGLQRDVLSGDGGDLLLLDHAYDAGDGLVFVGDHRAFLRAVHEGTILLVRAVGEDLRSGTEALYRGLADRRREAVEKGLCYYAIIACFVAGAVLGVVLTSFAPQRAVLAAAFFQLAAFFLMCRETPSTP